MELMQVILSNKQNLSDNDIEILYQVASNIDDFANLSIVDFAAKIFMSKSYILKLSQKLGFSGYSEFRYFLKQNQQKIKVSPSYQNSENLLLKDLDDTRNLLEKQHFLPISETVHNARFIFCYGTGNSQQSIMRQLSKNLMQAGKVVIGLPSKTELFSSISTMNENDLFIIASASGETTNTIELLHLIKAKKTKILSVTEFKKNSIATVADINIYFQTTPYYSIENPDGFFSFTPLEFVLDIFLRKYVDYRNQLNE